MPLLYFKLAEGQTSFIDEELDINLDILHPATVLDLDNMDTRVIEGLNSGVIIQINESDFIALNPPLDKLNVNTGYLITLTNFLTSCPNPNATFFCYYGGKWSPILFSQLKACLAVGLVKRLIWGPLINNSDENAPQPGNEHFNHPSLIGYKPDQLIVNLNGIELHHESRYDSVDLAAVDHYTLDLDGSGKSINGVFGKPTVPFQSKDILAITLT